MEEKEDKIISSFFGGGGDNLQFSTLPRRFSELGHKVYISTECAFRNEGIKSLVWLSNPFVLGFSKSPPNCGDGGGKKLCYLTDQFLSNWEISHGLEPQSKYPEIYFIPQQNKQVKDKILVDVTSTSGMHQGVYEPEPIRNYLKNNFAREDIVVCCFSDGISIPVLLMDGYEMIYVENIFYYCNLIHSCKKFVVLHSGGMVIASALKKYGDIDVDCLMTQHPVHKGAALNHHHFYDNINYIWLP